MKLIEMQVKNFRSLAGEEVRLSLTESDVIFIFGQNNTGKSSILSAYQYLVTPKQKADISDFIGFDVSIPIEISGIFLKEDEDGVEFQNKGLDKWVDDDNKIRFKKTWTNVGLEGLKYTYDPKTGAYQENGFGGMETIFSNQAPTALRIPAFPTKEDLSKICTDFMKKNVLKNLQEDERALYNQVLDKINEMQEKILTNSAIEARTAFANKLFKTVFPDLSIEINQTEGKEFDLVSALNKEYSVIIKDCVYPELNQEFNCHGHGVIRQAMFNFVNLMDAYVGYNDKSHKKKFLILYEEPEVYLHPKSIRMLRESLYELCQNSPFQLICVSHNPQLIDLSKPHTSLVRLTKNSDRTSSLHQVSSSMYAETADQKEFVQMINRFNPDVCESFFADEVILVEGDTEAIVVRHILAEYYPKKDMYVVNTGSKTNMPFYQAIFTHFRIKHHVVHDSDTRYIYKKNKQNGMLERSKKEDGSDKKNSAWSINNTIWQEIQKAKSIDKQLAARYVSIQDFEHANEYIYNSDQGKPLSAYKWVTTVQNIEEKQIFRFVKDIIDSVDRECEYSQDDLERMVQEPCQ